MVVSTLKTSLTVSLPRPLAVVLLVNVSRSAMAAGLVARLRALAAVASKAARKLAICFKRLSFIIPPTGAKQQCVADHQRR